MLTGVFFTHLRTQPATRRLGIVYRRATAVAMSIHSSSRVSSFPLSRTHTGSTLSAPDIEARNTFAYAPLSSDASIRILTLFPGQRGSPLVARLENEELGETAVMAAPYEAVSYVWGTGTRCSELRCNEGDDDGGGILPLTQSIDDALERLRLVDRPRRLWADQICINQEDVGERSQQVRLMNEIYRGAERVLVWLGRDVEGVAEDAVRMVKYLHGMFQVEEAHEEFRRAHSEGLLNQSEEPWIPLSKLTKLQWFTRIWIVQEIGTSTPATLFWGDAEVDWDELSSVASVLNVDYHYLRTRFQVFTPGVSYLHQRFVEPDNAEYGEGHNRGNFVYELHRARHLSAKDPRDHVYAFLGHFSLEASTPAKEEGGKEDDGDEEEVGLAGLEPDYSRTVEDVYIDVATRGLIDASTLIMLSACHAVQSPNRIARTYRRRLDLPSWVPDWRILPLHIIGSPETPHRACGGGDDDSSPLLSALPCLTIDRDANLLRITGVRVDVVARVWSPFHGKSFQMRDETKPSRRTPLEGIWAGIAGGGRQDFSLDVPYVDGRCSAFFALLQTLTNACIGGERARRYADTPETDWLANGAAYLVSSTRRDTGEPDIAPQLREMARAGTPYKWSHEATLVARYRRFAVTEGGYYLLGADVMQQGDVVVVLYGGRTPFMLRPRGDGRWMLLGECYMHGIMDGEALKMGAEEEVFTIS